MKRLSIAAMLIALLAGLPVQGAVENLTTWAEIDGGGDLTVTSTTITVDTMNADCTDYVAKTGTINANTELRFRFVPGSVSHDDQTCFLGVVAFSTHANNFYQVRSLGGDCITVVYNNSATGGQIFMWITGDSLVWAVSEQELAVTAGTTYYGRLIYTYNGGDNSTGLYTLHISTGNYYGETGATLVGTETVHAPAACTEDWSYTLAAQSRDDNKADRFASGVISNIEFYTAPSTPPDQAATPSPADDANDIPVWTDLSWAPASGAQNYDVYLAAGEAVDVNDPDHYLGNTISPTWDATLLYDTNYQWIVDANNSEGNTPGAVWNFSTETSYTGGDYGTYENFSLWTLVNTQSELSVTDANTITATTLSMDHSAYAYRNLGANYFAGDVTIRFRFSVTSATTNGHFGLVSLTDTPGSLMDWYYQSADFVGAWINYDGAYKVKVGVSAWDVNSATIAAGTSYYAQFERDDDAGDNSTGLLTLYITTVNYHGEAGAVPVATVLYDVPAAKQNDYDYAVTAFTKGNHGANAYITASVSHLDIGATVEPSYEPPGSASNFYPASGTTSVSTGVTLTWNAASGATNYNVYFGTPGSLSLIGNQTTRSYTPSGLENSTTYAWRIDPNNAYGTTTGSQLTFTTGAGTTVGDTGSVTQWGITWTFSADHTVGQFANGDYWVVGPVTITAISPSGTTQNGTMINPVTNTAQGFDSRSAYWSASTNIVSSLPVTVPVGSSVISSRSLTTAVSSSYVGYCAVLTVLAEAASEGDFRPPYFGTDKTLNWNTSQIEYDYLADVTAVSSAPTLATAAQWFAGPWIDFGAGWGGRSFHPAAQMPPYGRDLSDQVGQGALVLHLNYTDEQKAPLAINMIQLGIDNYGIASHPGGRTTWEADGGHCMGRKYPILMAGTLLGDVDMMAIADKSGAYLWSPKPSGGFYGPGDMPPDYIYFQEDMQTFHVSQADVDRTLASEITGHPLAATSTTITINGLPRWNGQPQLRYITITGGTGIGQTRWVSSSNYDRSNYPDDPVVLTISQAWTTTPTTASTYKLEGYVTADIGLAEWGIRHASSPTLDNPSWGADYRYTANRGYPGWVLAAHMLHIEDEWNHEPLFDWMDRWMTANLPGGDYPQADGGSWSVFNKDMWVAYRDNLPAEPNVDPNSAPATPYGPIPADEATGLDPSAVQLRWQGDATTWTILIGETTSTMYFSGESTTRSHTPATLDFDTTYYWQVIATNAYGSTHGPIWQFTTMSEVIAAPGTPGLQSPANGATNQPTSLSLRWGATSDTTRYDVWFGTSSLSLLGTTTNTSYAVSSLSNSTAYQWRIDAVGPGGASSSSVRTFTTVASGGTPGDPDSGGPGLPDLPTATTQTRTPQIEFRRTRSYSGLIAEPVEFDDGQPTTKATRSTLSGYLERIVIYTTGTDTQWSLTIKDAWGGLLFSATDLNMTEGTVAYDGQRLPFVGGLQVTVADTTTDTADEIWVYLLVDEAYRTRE